MRNYLDPRSYLFDRDEWENYAFVGRLHDLIEFLTDAKGFEDKAKLSGPLLRFRAGQCEAETIYLYNPFQNDPPIPPHYVRQFHEDVLPELVRRFEFCPLGPCSQAEQGEQSAPEPLDAADFLAASFISGTDICRLCSGRSRSCLVVHPDRRSIRMGTGFFDWELELDKVPPLALMSPLELFPDPSDLENRDRLMNSALRLERARLAVDDCVWNDYDLRTVDFSLSFWREIEATDWGGLDDKYKSQIINTLVQISCGRSTSANMHRMKSQVAVIDGVSRPRWNAYVFQSGASEIDRRCSRIYYAFSGGRVHIEAFESDAH